MGAPSLLGLCGKDNEDGEQHEQWSTMIEMWFKPDDAAINILDHI